MTSRLRAPGVRQPVSSKLARPGTTGSGQKPTGIRKTSPSPQTAEVLNSPRVPQAQNARKVADPTFRAKQVSPALPRSNATTNGDRSLQVGDRVLVSGKPGLLAFLGNTQFAKGTWAGIILDSFDGKNNGSVNDVQYFKCEPSRGLFARPEKIKFVSRGEQDQSRSTEQPRPPLPTNDKTPAQTKFEVGDRILVDGLKEGIIGFLGETQFSKGIWAGVILDSPEGKNNGTLNDVKYFECEPNYGLFTRPHKLKLISKSVDKDSPQRPPSSVTPVQGASQRASQPTPVDLKALHEKLKIGDHVLVGGIKEGILRYLGPTEFAKGIWVGVELPEPMGKNDGAISGKRYFQCEAKHGLFAPLPKVEKLATAGSEGGLSTNPSQTSLTASPTVALSPHHSPKMNMVHASNSADPGGVTMTPPVGPRGPHLRHLSESSTSSFGSARIQDTMLTESADLEYMLEEKENVILSLQATLDQRELEKQAHQEELTELRRQVDDLQFQLEEQNVISGDQLETATENNVQTMSKLTQDLEEERKLTQQLRQSVSSGVVIDESESQRELTDVRRRLEERSHEISTQQATIAQLTEEVRQVKERAEADHKHSSSLEIELTENNQKLEAQVSSLEEELSLKKAALEAEQSRYTSLEAEFSHNMGHMKGERDRCSSLERELSQTEKAANNLQAELGISQQRLEEALDLCSQHEILIEQRNGELDSLEEKLRQLMKEKELWSGERARLQAEQERVISERDRTIVECDNLMTQTANSSSEQNKLGQQRRELLSERESLLAQQQAMYTEHEKLVSERDNLLQQVNELQQQRQDVLGASQNMSLKFSSTQGELMQATAEMEKLKLEFITAEEAWDHERFTLLEQVELSRAGAVEVEQRVSSIASERDSTLQEAQALADRLEKSESERDRLQLDLETAQIQIEELQFQLDDLSTRHKTLEEETTAEVLAVQQRLDATEVVLAERERELATAEEKLSSLSDDLIASQGKHDQILLEEEKLLLEERVKELILQLEAAQEKSSKSVLKSSKSIESDNLSSRLEETQAQLLESQTFQEDLLQKIEDYKQQTDFLNSVIADLQNKLEGVEAMKGLHGNLESVSDYAVDDDDELQGLPPPRLFCDICDVFDQHDTDDCPMQTTSDSSPPHSMHHGSRAPGGSDRPYCDNCEVFGHATNECEYEVTY